MKRSFLSVTFLWLVLASMGFSQVEPSNPAQAHIVKEVRHELLNLPWFGVFDNITFQVNGSEVTLHGAVNTPGLKSDAEKAVKQIDGVTHVTNDIEVLPASPNDDQLRRALFRAIYGDSVLEKYAMGVQKPIRIIVKGGHVTLEGVVDNQNDKNVANIRANGVAGVFSVANNLRVVRE